MVARLNRNSPLPEGRGPRVQDDTTQRALDAIWTPLKAVLSFLQPFVQQEDWKALPFYSDWTRTLATLQAPSYLKNPLGRVELRGWATTAAGTSSTIAVLPVGYRPSERCSFPGFRLTGGGVYAVARIDVDVDGRVLLASPAVAAGDSVSLDGMSFDTR